MRIYVKEPAGLSKAMERVSNALEKYALPGDEVVQHESDAELVVLHVIGYEDLEQKLTQLRSLNQRYAIIQYCLRTTSQPTVHRWQRIWQGAELVWSYYDLRSLSAQDGFARYHFNNFYYAPLGVDAEVFQPRPLPKNYVVLSSGYVASSESIGEVVEAARRVQRRVFHLGPALDLGSNVTSAMNIDDVYLSMMYNTCDYVVGLRRVEGFELPAAEGLLCGTRPILFDRRHYRQWFEPWGLFIREEEPKQVVQSLERIFSTTPKPVSAEERAAAAERFNWSTIVTGFWREVKRHVETTTSMVR